MNQDLHDRIEDYLDGALDDEAARRFEQDLLQAEVAAQFREALLLRDLLGSLPPDQPPEGLVERIESALIQNRRTPEPQFVADSNRRYGALMAAFKAGLRWPEYVFAGLASGSSGMKGSINGVKTIGYALGPLQVPARRRMQTVRFTRKPIWKIALSRVWQGASA
jgi:anti-sigma factor RsiW